MRGFTRLIAVASVALAGCSAPETTKAPLVPSTAASAPTTQPAPVTTVAFVPPGCTPATADDVQAITADLPAGQRLGEAFTTTTGARRWINANIYDAAGRRLSSADVWIIDNGKIWGLSSDARRSSPDGRRLPGNPSAGDDVAANLQTQCVVPALQHQNGK